MIKIRRHLKKRFLFSQWKTTLRWWHFDANVTTILIDSLWSKTISKLFINYVKKTECFFKYWRLSRISGVSISSNRVKYWCIYIWFSKQISTLKVYTLVLRPGSTTINTLRSRQNGRHFADYIFKIIFLDDTCWIFTQITLKFVPMGPINNKPSFV